MSPSALLRRTTLPLALAFFLLLLSSFCKTIIELASRYIWIEEKANYFGKSEVEEYKVWFRGCTHVLVDLGANRGDTIMRWLTEELYSGRAKSSEVDRTYSVEQRKKFCVLSFEPNGMFDSRLLKLGKEMYEQGFKVKVKLRTAASTQFAKSYIYVDNVSPTSFGTSLIPDKKINFEGKLHALGERQPVDLVDLVSILRVVPINIELVVKMDIEGGEYDILRSLISSGIACTIKILIIEYHAHKLRKGAVPAGINDALEWILESRSCGVKIIHDD